MKKNDILKTLGAACQYYRTEALNRKQIDVSRETNYSIENVSSFENGRNNNAMIFLWYVNHGFSDQFLKNYIGGDIYEYFKAVN